MSKKRDRTRRPTGPGAEPDPAATGSIDVQFSHPRLPAAGEPGRELEPPPPESSGSLDVQFSSPTLPAARAEPAPRRRPRPKTVPGIIAESLSQLPVVKEVMPRTRKARVLVRSMIVAFALIAIWIGVIVYLQTRAEEKPDFRPQVEQLLIDLREGRAGDVYDRSSTRFQELVLEDTFIDQVEDMNESLGEFLEVASIYKTNMYRGPSGRTARVELLLEFEHGRARSTMSFHKEGGTWRMLGFGVELPEDVAKRETSEEKRRARVEAPPEIVVLADRILQLSRDGKAGEIWDNAADVFKASVSRADFEVLEAQRRAQLGPYMRILKVYSSRQNPAKTGASLDALIEFNKGPTTTTISGNFKFSKIAGEWKLAFYKLILPMPRGMP